MLIWVSSPVYYVFNFRWYVFKDFFHICYFVGLSWPEKNENLGILVIDSEWETHVFYITYKIWYICQKAILTFLFVEPTKAMGLLT